MMRSVKGEVVSFTFVELAYRHVQLAEIVIEKGANSTDIAENLNDVRASNIYLLVHKYETPLNVITHGMYSIPSRHDSKARHAHPTKLIEAHPSKIWYAEEEDLGIVFFFVFLQEIAPLLARVEWSRLM
ncbi:Transcription termination factor Rho [Dirofilaria immitis]|nr:Transcription termination factor Rho [Dirofilaria immitis]